MTTVPEGCTTLLVCVATGFPYPQMSWLKNGTQITNTTDDVTIFMTRIEEGGVHVIQSVLEVCDVRGEEVYTCKAINSDGEDSVTFDLIGGILRVLDVIVTTVTSKLKCHLSPFFNLPGGVQVHTTVADLEGFHGCHGTPLSH